MFSDEVHRPINTNNDMIQDNIDGTHITYLVIKQLKTYLYTKAYPP